MNIIYTILIGISLFLTFGQIHRYRRARNKVIHIVDDKCDRCRCCLKKCRHKVLDMENDSTGGHIAIKHPERCTACGDCVTACKFNALELINRKQKL